ncbi:MAG: NAD(P)H-dependent oxidoreductase [Solirubrobacterales bacterium]
MRVLGISGSLRRDSLNSALLRAAAERLPAGAELVFFDRLADIPPFSEDAEASPAPDAVRELREAIRAADAVLIATPEYNHSLPGQLKNALDWASRPAGQSALNGKPAAAIGASKSMFGGVWAQAELRKVLAAMGGRVIEAELPVPHAHEHLVGDRLELELEQAERLDEILAELVAAAEAEAGLEPIAA